MKVKDLIAKGILKSPNSDCKLSYDDSKKYLISSNNEKFELYNEIPVLLKNKEDMERYLKASEIMNKRYTKEYLERERKSLFGKIKKFYQKDHRSRAALNARNQLIESIKDRDVAISIGGGPHRLSSKLINVNIGPFPEVDLVADAHHMPFIDGSVDYIECEAVIEHLYDPNKAVAEMFRICKKVAQLYICTLFMQPYHGYPYHYQNYTLTGQVRLFENAGFKIIEKGTCVGPSYTIAHLNFTYLRKHLPKIIGIPLSLLWLVFFPFLKAMDIFINKKENSYILASTTYILAEKLNKNK